jgi:hypothetical protein
LRVKETLFALFLSAARNQRFNPKFFTLPVGLFALPEGFRNLPVQFVGSVRIHARVL